MGRRLNDREKAEARTLAYLWESSKHKNARVTITVHDEADEAGRAIYDVEIHARSTLPAATHQQQPVA